MSSNFSWYDPTKVQAATDASRAAGAGVQGDGRVFLGGNYMTSIMNPLSGGTVSGAGMVGPEQYMNGADSYDTHPAYYDPGHFDANGQQLSMNVGSFLGHPNYGATVGPADKAAYDAAMPGWLKSAGLDPTKQYAVGGNFDTPGGNAGKDITSALYQLGPNGTATPIGAQNSYIPSSWVGSGREFVKDMGMMVAAGVGGAALAGGSAAGAGGTAVGTEAGGAAGAAGGASAGMSSADLAALHSAAGYGAATSADAGFAGLGATTAGGSAGLTAADLAGLQAGTGTVAAGSSPLASLGNYMSNMNVGKGLQLAKAGLGLYSAFGGGSGGGSPSGASTGLGAGSAASPQDMGPAARYAYNGFTPSTAGMPPPSAAVNLQDPSAAMFGYGQTPTYYKKPGMADGGAVDDPTNAPYSTEGDAYGLMAPSATNSNGQDGYDLARDVGNSGLLNNPTQSGSPQDGSTGGGLSGWWDRYLAGDKKAQSQANLGMSGLGLLASLLNRHASGGAPGFQSIAALRAGLPSGDGAMTPQQLAWVRNYFNSPGSTYVPGAAHNPFLAPQVVTTPHMASGGNVQPSGMPAYSPDLHGSLVRGEGSGQADKVDAALSPGEYVWDSDTVSALGDGNNEHGARLLDATREAIRAHKRAAPVSEIPPQAHSPLQYMKMARSK